MSEFTKGKWIIDRDGSAIFSDSEDCYVAELSPANSDEQVAANARLIAAAPEMYRLLQEFIKIDEQKKWAASEKNDPAYMMALVAQDGAVNMSKELLARIDDEEAHS